jgi:hypothetical protein
MVINYWRRFGGYDECCDETKMK